MKICVSQMSSSPGVTDRIGLFDLVSVPRAGEWLVISGGSYSVIAVIHYVEPDMAEKMGSEVSVIVKRQAAVKVESVDVPAM